MTKANRFDVPDVVLLKPDCLRPICHSRESGNPVIEDVKTAGGTMSFRREKQMKKWNKGSKLELIENQKPEPERFVGGDTLSRYSRRGPGGILDSRFRGNDESHNDQEHALWEWVMTWIPQLIHFPLVIPVCFKLESRKPERLDAHLRAAACVDAGAGMTALL